MDKEELEKGFDDENYKGLLRYIMCTITAVLTICVQLQYWQDVYNYSTDQMCTITVLTRCVQLQYWQDVYNYSTDQMCTITVLTRCVQLQYWQDVYNYITD